MDYKKITRVFFTAVILTFVSGARAQDLRISTVRMLPNVVEVEITLVNNLANDILIVSPYSGQSEKSNYFLVWDRDAQQLDINRFLFAYPPYVTIDAKEICSGLTRIKAGEFRREVLLVPYPRPANQLPVPQDINLLEIARIRFQVGLLPFDPAIIEVVGRRPKVMCVNGHEHVSTGTYRGQSLIEIQKILSASVIVDRLSD